MRPKVLPNVVLVCISGYSIGLYTDDSLAVSSSTPRQIEILKKEICQFLYKNSLQVTTDARSKVVHFLNITLDLRTGTHMPFMKDTCCGQAQCRFIHLQLLVFWRSSSIQKNIQVVFHLKKMRSPSIFKKNDGAYHLKKIKSFSMFHDVGLK